eukprot:scaffold257286_cov68-Attheya_sp.AAC.5
MFVPIPDNAAAKTSELAEEEEGDGQAEEPIVNNDEVEDTILVADDFSLQPNCGGSRNTIGCPTRAFAIGMKFLVTITRELPWLIKFTLMTIGAFPSST